ncbi:MAG: hypothetical protein AB7I04_02105 [Pseudomonadales bacterium]
MTARTFISAYRYDPVRILFLRRILPVLVWISVLGALLVPVLVLGSLWQQAEDAQRQELVLLLTGMAALMLSVPGVMQWFVWHTRREVFDTEWRLDEWGLTRHRGHSVSRRRWAQVRGLDRVALGRLQVARVRADGGSLWFDAAMIEQGGPAPRLKWGTTRMALIWPDGRERPLTIDTSELYQAFAERLATDG